MDSVDYYSKIQMSCKPKVPYFEPWTYILAYRYQKQNKIKLAQGRSKTFLYYDPSDGDSI